MKIVELYSTYVDGEPNVHLFSSSELFMDVYNNYAESIDMELIALYGQRDFFNPFENVDTFVYWQKCWLAFCKRNAHNFNRMWEDLNKDYDFNVLFSRHKDRTLDYIGKEKENVSLGQGKIENVLGEVPNDSASGAYKDVNKSTTTDMARQNDTIREYENRQDKEVENTSGNTGVYTNTDLLEREYLFRIKNDFFIDIFSKFLGEVTIYE